MKLLILTQAVDLDDPHLNFFHDWIADFACEVDQVTVICLKKGRFSLPQNVEVLSLGKESGQSRIKYVTRLFSYVWSRRTQYDNVFVHMNPEYVVLCGWLWKLLHKKVFLWYIHRSVDMKLRIAEKFADHIFSSTKESFRIPSKKVEFVGHGINTDVFKPIQKIPHEKVRIIHIGRITQIKNCEILIEAAALLRQSISRPLEIRFIGESVTREDKEYSERLKKLIQDKNVGDSIVFAGSSSNAQLPNEFANADFSVNMTPTGGMDKVVLESLATGTLVVVANEAFRDLFGNYADVLIATYRDPENLAQKIQHLLESDTVPMIHALEEKVHNNFSRGALIAKIVSRYTS